MNFVRIAAGGPTVELHAAMGARKAVTVAGIVQAGVDERRDGRRRRRRPPEGTGKGRRSALRIAVVFRIGAEDRHELRRRRGRRRSPSEIDDLLLDEESRRRRERRSRENTSRHLGA